MQARLGGGRSQLGRFQAEDRLRPRLRVPRRERLPAVCALCAEAFQPSIAKHLRRVERSAPIHEEVEQKVWDALLVGGTDGPKLATYAGRGSLGGWIGISAQRIALMMLRHERAESRARNEVAARNRLATDDPEMASIKERYRTQFQEAVGAAIATLDDRDRTIYRMHLVDGVTLERIGKAYGVTHPTVMRWLDRARERLVEEAKRRLRETLPCRRGSSSSIARLLALRPARSQRLSVSSPRRCNRTGFGQGRAL